MLPSACIGPNAQSRERTSAEYAAHRTRFQLLSKCNRTIVVIRIRHSGQSVAWSDLVALVCDIRHCCLADQLLISVVVSVCVLVIMILSQRYLIAYYCLLSMQDGNPTAVLNRCPDASATIRRCLQPGANRFCFTPHSIAQGKEPLSSYDRRML